jgi:hypothetical protein
MNHIDHWCALQIPCYSCPFNVLLVCRKSIALLPRLDGPEQLDFLLLSELSRLDPTWRGLNRKHHLKSMNQRLIVIYCNGRTSYIMFALFSDPGGLMLSASESCRELVVILTDSACVTAFAKH